MLDQKLLKELQGYVQLSLHQLSFDIHEQFHEETIKDVNTFELQEFIENKQKPTFNQVLFRFIDRKGMKDSEVYKKASMDRRHFSKIRSTPHYRPGKNTTLALTFALELNMDDTEELLSAAGYALSDSDTFDLIIQFFLEKERYDIDVVNEALDYYGLKPLIGSNGS
ncbi:hypothetical protein [Halalkalibacter urbisdiaboli]|uniref:hypothetical protein n=1 Tax=Halalkalibacter urbisdiaboli TaxID=1960589 RepID=UPI000B4512A7|nr:hypothetical protein [Halalkalibacter urbisdiaboli]